MKRTFTCLLALLASFATWADNVEVDGIYYELDYPSRTASVTYNMVTAGNYATYSGDVVIPSAITWGDTEYIVTTIGAQAFLQSKELTSVTIPETVTLISANAFGSCTGLTSITIPNSVKEFGGFVFSSCTNLKTVKLGNGITKLGGRMFQGCTKLESINIPEGVTFIEDYTFEVCRALPSIDIPASCTKIGTAVFRACNALQTIRVAADNPIYDSRGNCNAIIETATNKLIAGCNGTVIPNTVTVIGESAFQEIIGRTSLTIPGSVKTIEYAAFKKNSLTDVTFSEGLQTIDGYAFDGCGSLTTVLLPKTVTAIGSYAFNNCMHLNVVKAFMPEPFLLDGTAFARIDGTCVLYVPKGTRDAYIEKRWNENIFMGGIKEMDEAGISTTTADARLASVRKVLDSGRITIITPGNRRYSIGGNSIE